MKQMVEKSIEDYARANSLAPDPLLEELREYTLAHMDYPQMQVGALEGAFLKVLARLTAAKRILEVGTFTGYSSLMMAAALPADGRLITCEIDPQVAAVAQSFFDRSPHGSKITLEIGHAADSIAGQQGPFDMAFIDADKSNYISYFDLILPKMRKGGLIAADNVLWSGRVLEREQEQSTKAIVAFNKHVASHQALDRVMVTIRDGITLVVT
jgi:caffeoyl-CoA O-methyltransferase